MWDGSIARRPMGALALALSVGGVAAGAGACKRDPEIQERPVYVHSLRACPVAQSDAFSVIYANGDFEPSDKTVVSLFLRDVGTELTDLPSETRSLIVDISQPLKNIDWRGTGEVPKTGPVNVLVWPGGETCRMTRNVEPRNDMIFGVFGRHVMIAGGRETGAQVPLSYVGDLSTGIIDKLAFGLGRRRARGTVTSFRTSPDQDPAPALVAGGEDPDSEVPLDSAEVYTPIAGANGDIGDFERERIDLSEPRKKHGAVVLVNGETLLVGGIDQSGGPTRTMEIVDPKTRRRRVDGVAKLATPRSSPTVLRLASGEILVAGGFGDRNVPVPTLEWFFPDASGPSRRPIDLVTGRERAFVALDSGGALAVIAPTTSSPSFPTVWVISADGTLEAGLPVDPTSLDVVRLFPGVDGQPVLWTGSRWLRWEPWFSAFQPLPDAPTGELGGPKTTAIASGDPGLALWLEDRGGAGMYVTGFRHGTRSRFGVVQSPLLVDGTAGLAPDRAAGLPGSPLRFVRGRGLELGPGASAFLTDVTFANVSVDVDVAGAAPVVVLRQESGRELAVGGAACAIAQSAKRSLHVERTGRRVSVRIDGGDDRACPTELDDGVRVAIGVRGADAAEVSVASNLRVVRR